MKQRFFPYRNHVFYFGSCTKSFIKTIIFDIGYTFFNQNKKILVLKTNDHNSSKKIQKMKI